jgi:DNA-binding winged helix-turn-helix (wHTH) protein
VLQDPGATRIHLGGAVQDLDRGTLTRDGQVVPLRSKSFRLLCELARSPGAWCPGQTPRRRVAGRDRDRSLPQPSGPRCAQGPARRGRQLLRTVARRGFMLCPSEPPPASERAQSPGQPPSSARPRIALLPLINRTALPDHGPILDGLVEEITAGLARFRDLNGRRHATRPLQWPPT